MLLFSLDEDGAVILLILLIIFCFIFKFPEYQYNYVDINDNIGTSNNCFINSYMYCISSSGEYIQVKKYTEEIVNYHTIIEKTFNR